MGLVGTMVLFARQWLIPLLPVLALLGPDRTFSRSRRWGPAPFVTVLPKFRHILSRGDSR